MLEIGVQSGGSLEMWKDYFGDKLELHGLDVNPLCKGFENKALDTYIHIGSQHNATFLRDLMEKHGPFDIILDDGSHQSLHILTAFQVLYPTAVKKDGVYLVEDLMTNYWNNKEFNEGVKSDNTFMHYSKHLLNMLNAYNSVAHPTFNPNGAQGRPPNTFTRSTLSMSYYDGMLVFERGNHEPWVDVYAGKKQTPFVKDIKIPALARRDHL
jgi:hypothetical protein